MRTGAEGASGAIEGAKFVDDDAGVRVGDSYREGLGFTLP